MFATTALPVLIGALAVGVWSRWNYHEPFGRLEIRYAVRWPRYLFGVAAYVVFGVIFYVLLCLALVWLGRSLTQLGIFKELTNGLAEVEGVGLAALLAAVLCTVVFPIVPFTQGLICRAREAAQKLALYPYARITLTNSISLMAFNPSPEASGAVGRELMRYGVPPKAMSLLSNSSTAARSRNRARNLCGEKKVQQANASDRKTFSSFLRVVNRRY
jgi:hypothetical protein